MVKMNNIDFDIENDLIFSKNPKYDEIFTEAVIKQIARDYNAGTNKGGKDITTSELLYQMGLYVIGSKMGLNLSPIKKSDIIIVDDITFNPINSISGR